MLRKENDPRWAAPSRTHAFARRVVVALAIGLISGPFVYEGAAVLTAKWKTLLGHPAAASTPVCDSVTGWVHQVRRSGNRAFHTMRWSPSLVIPLAISWALAAGVLMRRCGARE